MLGVRPEMRGAALGERLKIAQRERALAAGVDLIEWTFDPLQAQNAHLNMSVLGCVASTYRVDAYGAMSGPLHRGTPTDRLVAEWELVTPHVVRRLARRQAGGASLPTPRTVDLRDVPSAYAVTADGDWSRSGEPSLDLDAPRIFVPVPPRFSDLQQDQPDLAMAWRLTSRAAFTAYFARGYRVVDFLREGSGGGSYLLATDTVPRSGRLAALARAPGVGPRRPKKSWLALLMAWGPTPTPRAARGSSGASEPRNHVGY